MTVTALTRRRQPEEEISRLLECTRCRELVRVYEVPQRFLDERAYVCGNCLGVLPGMAKR